MKTSKMLLILAVLALVSGFVLIVKGILAGVLLFLLAFAIFAFYIIKARNAAGYKSDDFFMNGISGKGRDQSEVIKKDKDRI